MRLQSSTLGIITHPPTQFPPLWAWLATQIQIGELVMSVVALEEAAQKIPECGTWLANNQLQQLPVTNIILEQALHIKNLLGIVDDRYHPKGVGENDILIIATAQVHHSPLVSNEGMQAITPNELSKCRIPKVCSFPQVGVNCLNFLDFIKRSGAIFG